MKHRATILIAEDEEEVLETIKYICELHNFDVVGTATDGLEALKLYFETNPDILLLDLAMPRMDGMAVIKEIMKEDPGANILVVSALYRPEMKKNSLKAGAKGFVLKPFEVTELISKIEEIIAN